MTNSERLAIVTQIALRAGYTLTVRDDPDQGKVIRVDNADGWYMEFSRADAINWAKAVYQAHG